MRNETIEKARSGDQEALLQLWQGVRRLAHRVIRRYRTDGAVDFEDLEQCVFLGVYEAVRTYAPDKGSFTTWAVLNIRRACRDALGLGRANRAAVVSLDEPIPGTQELTIADTIPDEAASFERSELRQDIEKALERLPENMAQVIRLHDLDGLPLGMAAERQCVPQDTATKWRREGFRQLRRDRGLRAYHEPVRLRYKGVRAFRNDWTSVVEEEVIRRLDGQDIPAC